MCEPGKPCPGAEDGDSLPEAFAKLFNEAQGSVEDRLELANALLFSSTDNMIGLMRRISEEHPEMLEWEEARVIKNDFLSTTLYRIMDRGMGITMLTIKVGKDGKLDTSSVEAKEIVEERAPASN